MVMTQPIVLAGDYTLAGLPPASSYRANFAWVNDQFPNPKLYYSNGSAWMATNKRNERFAGTTNASGDFTVVYSPAYPSTPDPQPVLDNPTTEAAFRVTAKSATGFTVNVFQRNLLTVLGINLLSFGTSPVPSQSIYVNVFEN